MSERIATLDVIGGQVNLTQYAAGARKGICVQLDLRVDDGALDYVGLNVAQAHQLVVVLDNWIQKVLHSRPVTFEEREHWDVARAAALQSRWRLEQLERRIAELEKKQRPPEDALSSEWHEAAKEPKSIRVYREGVPLEASGKTATHPVFAWVEWCRGEEMIACMQTHSSANAWPVGRYFATVNTSTERIEFVVDFDHMIKAPF